MIPSIIYQDEHLFVLNKPAGWISDISRSSTNKPVIQKWVSESFEYPINTAEYRNGIVHRLDKETSGIMLIAKTELALNKLQIQFKNRKVSKTYIALVHGLVEDVNNNEAGTSGGLIDAPVGRLPWRRDRFGVMVGGREAVTEYAILDYLQHDKEQLTLLELKPKTGRTHQIRIHLKHINHPIVADEFYAGRKTARADRKWCGRLFLHARDITFFHPITDELMQFRADLPQDLTNALENTVKIP